MRKALCAIALSVATMLSLTACGSEEKKAEKNLENVTEDDFSKLDGDSTAKPTKKPVDKPADKPADTPAADEGKDLSAAEVGDTVVFGTYEQDGSESNGKEPIEWTVLDKDGDKILLISNQLLDCVKYNEKKAHVTWETCTLRTWINDSFYNEAFSNEEQGKIVLSKVTADPNPLYDPPCDSGNDTEDKVFLLSIAEIIKYYPTDESRSKLTPTQYAINKECSTKDGYAGWLTRTPRNTQDLVAVVNKDGSLSLITYVNDDSNCVRPAIWVNTK